MWKGNVDYRVGGIALLAFISLTQSGCVEYCVGCPKNVDVGFSQTHLSELETGAVWARAPLCPDDVDLERYDVALDENCKGGGVVGTMTPVVEWAWDQNDIHPGYDQVMSTPIAGNMTDDNGDGRIDSKDIPDIAFTSFKAPSYSSYGALNVVSGDTGELIWSQTSIGGFRPKGSTGVALADLGDGEGLGLFLMTEGGLTAVNVDGSPRWTTEYNDSSTRGWTYPAVYDMEGDGVAEIIVGRSVFEADGTLRWRGAYGTGSSYHISFAMDLDEDGLAEVIAGDTIYNYDGTARSVIGGDGTWDGFTAVADLDGDGRPDIVTVGHRWINARDLDGNELWHVNYSSAGLYGAGGGAPTIADFDGDGEPEIGVASSSFYRVFNGHNGSLLWQMPIIDPSSYRTASSVFDFEGDGSAEVVYADEHTLWVFDGATGHVELEWDAHSSGTLCEYPIIVDIDNDGSSEIVVASSNYQTGESNGITVIGDLNDSWAPARSIWNQHAYSITNINDDGTVPSIHPAHWLDRNNFRAGNSETRIGFEQYDLMVGNLQWCLDECSQGSALMWIPIENGGLRGATDIVTTVYTTNAWGEMQALYSESSPGLDYGEQSWLELPVELRQTDFEHGAVRVEVRSQESGDAECDPNSNVFLIEEWPCSQ